MRSQVPISTQQILRDIYMPGATGVCLAIKAAPEKAFEFTYVGRAVAIVTDGSAVTQLVQMAQAGHHLIDGKAEINLAAELVDALSSV